LPVVGKKRSVGFGRLKKTTASLQKKRNAPIFRINNPYFTFPFLPQGGENIKKGFFLETRKTRNRFIPTKPNQTKPNKMVWFGLVWFEKKTTLA